MKTAVNIILVCFLLLTFNTVFAQKQGLEAIDSLKKDLATHPKQDSFRVKAIYKVTNAYISINPDSAMAYARTGLELAKKVNFPKGEAGFINVTGMLYSDKGSYDKARQYYNDAIKIYERIGNKRNQASSLNNIGASYQRQGDFAKSLEITFKALHIAEDIGEFQLAATFNNNIANIYSSQQDYTKALTFHLKALKNYEKLDDKDGIAHVYNSIANGFNEQKKYKDAVYYYQKSLALYQYLGNKIGEATIFAQLAITYTDDLDKRLEYFLKAQKVFDEINPTYISSITNIGNIGVTYAGIITGEYKLDKNKKHPNVPDDPKEVTKKGEQYLKKAIAYSKQTGDKDNMSYFSNELAQLQQKTGNYKEALENFVLYKSINDSLYSQESKNKIAELTAKYAFQKKEDAYKQQQQISDLKMRQIFLYAVLAVLFISAILIFLLNRSRIGQLRLKNELQKKAAEEQTRELLHKNKLSESELKAIRAQMNPHFIFNVLNSIESYIMENDPKMACRLVQKFASLSRIILENSTQSLVTAEREWKALQLYTELEAMRFNHHFTYSFTADPLIDLSALMLPPMLVQPLIENSIHHGLRNSPDDNKALTVKLEQTEHELLFTVEDNGVGIDEKAKPKTSAIKGKSIGLSAIRERIGIINFVNDNQAAEFDIHAMQPPEGKGTIAKLKLPKIFRNA